MLLSVYCSKIDFQLLRAIIIGGHRGRYWLTYAFYLMTITIGFTFVSCLKYVKYFYFDWKLLHCIYVTIKARVLVRQINAILLYFM